MAFTPQDGSALLAPEPAIGSRSSFRLVPRLISLAILFALELVPVSQFIQDRRGGAGRPLEHFAVAFATVLAALLYLKSRDLLQRISGQLDGFGWGFLAGHVAAVLVLIGLSSLPIGTHPAGLIKLGRILSGLGSVAFGVFTFVPPKLCMLLFRGTAVLWAYAAAAGGVASLLVDVSWSLWQPATQLTFAFVRVILGLFTTQVISDPATATIGTPGFQVIVGAPCSGLEGVGLMLVFSLGWLWFFRRECRFPQALLLVPAGLLTIWIMNALRITVLILIGSVGAPDVAEGGFHSQAGWIAFNAVALGFALTVRRLRWVTVSGQEQTHEEGSARTPVAAYLLPFLAILASAMISRAASGNFEWLYPLRFLAAAGVLWHYRSEYTTLDWKFGPVAVLTGGVVLGIWIALDSLSGTHSGNGISQGLAQLPAPGRLLWLACRSLAAVVTVPIAEELAFRAFLIRRVISADFDRIDPRTFTYVALAISSLAFGLLHGERWIAGTAAGLLYAMAYLLRGRIGDAVAAHATTNACLAALVLVRGKWYLW